MGVGWGGETRLENHKWIIVSLEILVQTPLEVHLEPLSTDPPRDAIGPQGPIASRGRSARPSVKYVDDLKKQQKNKTKKKTQQNVQDPLTEFSGPAHTLCWMFLILPGVV